MKKILLAATVQSHIAQFHMPLICLLKKSNCIVHVAARNNLREKNGLKIQQADKVYDVPFDRSPLSFNNIHAYKKLKKLIDKNRYDIIHCNTPMGGFITRLAARNARRKGAKVFYTAHGFHFYKGAPFKNWIVFYTVEKFMTHYTDKLITISEEDYALASKKFSLPVFRIHGVGVNVQRYFPYNLREKTFLRERFGLSEDIFIALCTGELNNNKNQSTVIRAFAEVVKAEANVHLLLAGNGPMENELRDLAKKLSVEKKVTFLGYRTDIEKFVNIADVVISASVREGLGLSVIEAMLCEKPVIVSTNRGHRELVSDGITGYIVPSLDIKTFSEKILKLQRDRKLGLSMGSLGRNKMCAYSEESVLKELKQIYGF